MARKLGQWVWVYPNTPIMMPENAIATLRPDYIALPVRGYAHTLAVMGPPNREGLRECIGYTIIGGSKSKECPNHATV